MLVVEKFPGANTLEVTKGVEDALDKLKPGLSGHADGHVRVPAGDLHRGRDRQPDARDRDRGDPAGAGARRVPVPVADGADRARDDPGVAGRGGARAGRAGRDLQRDLVRGSRGRRWRSSIDDAVVGAENVGTAPAPASRGRERRLDRAGRRRRLARGAQPARVRDADRAAGDRAGRGHGGPARRVLRAPGACVRAGGRRRDGRRAHAHAGAQPDALLEGHARAARSRRSWRRLRPALRRRAVALRAQPAHGADRRGGLRGRRAGGAAAARHVGDPVVQGPRRAGPPRRRARHVEPAHDADHDAGQPRAAGHPGCRQRRRARGSRDRLGPGRRRQLQRGLGQHRLRRRLRRDASRPSRTRSDGVRRRASRRRHLLDAEDQGRRRAATKARTRSRATASTC